MVKVFSPVPLLPTQASLFAINLPCQYLTIAYVFCRGWTADLIPTTTTETISPRSRLAPQTLPRQVLPLQEEPAQILFRSFSLHFSREIRRRLHHQLQLLRRLPDEALPEVHRVGVEEEGVEEEEAEVAVAHLHSCSILA